MTEPLNADALREYARLLAHQVADGQPDGDKTSLQLAAKEIAQLKRRLAEIERERQAEIHQEYYDQQNQ